MAGWLALLAVYLVGGVTFIPLLLAAAVFYGTRPAPRSSTLDPDHRTDASTRTGASVGDDDADDTLARPGDDVAALEAVRREHAQSRARQGSDGGGETRKRKPDAAEEVATAGYFAVMRTYVAMGVNTKPVEPSTVGPTPVAPASPSVYQNFFRNMLNGKKQQQQQPGPEAVEISHAAAPRPKNARNMFYVVLRHGYLILFDDDQQVDVRHVIKLADHEVGVYAGQAAIPEGELFIKRNALVLAPKAGAASAAAAAHHGPAPRPWFFYSENCSDKEDFYFALVRGQARAPVPRTIDVRHLTSLMERLHASDEAAEMRWFNAVLGRLFLGVYRTPELLAHVRQKVVTKLSRTPRPGFLSKLHVQRVDIGETTPQFTRPRLKSLTADGECIVEADVRYAGHIEIDIAATFRVSTPIAPQEVKTQLAVVLTRLDGHVLFKIKAPPSNRIWFAFRHMPKVEMAVRPIIMARQLTWPVFIQMIENRIKEAMAESIVLPFWDDMPFFATDHKKWRGGIWEEEEEEEEDDDDGGGGGENDNDEKNKNPSDRNDQDLLGDAASVRTTETSEGGPPAGSSGASIHGHDGSDETVSPAVLRLRRLSKSYTAPPASTPPASPPSTSLNRVATEALEKGRASLAKRRQKRNTVYGGGDNDLGPRSSATTTASSPNNSTTNSTNNSTASLPRRFSRAASSLTSAPVPIAETDNVHAEVFKASASPPKGGKTAMAWLAARAPPDRKSSASSASSADGGGGGGGGHRGDEAAADAERGGAHATSRRAASEGDLVRATDRAGDGDGGDHSNGDDDNGGGNGDDDNSNGNGGNGNGGNGNGGNGNGGNGNDNGGNGNDEAWDTAPDALPAYLKTREATTRGRAGSTTNSSSGRSTAFSSARASVTSLSTPGGTVTTTITGGGGHPGGHPGDNPDAATSPPKRTVALAAATTAAAAVSGAAGAAKRWGIGALQRRQAAAQERAKQRAQAQFASNHGAPLDLSKPMGGGMPLPPPGEPLPRPSDLVAAKDKDPQSHQAVHRKPVPPLSRRTTADELGRDHEARSSEEMLKRQRQKQQQQQQQQQQQTLEEKLRALARANAPPPQQDMLVVEAPIESESEDDEEAGEEAEEEPTGSKAVRATEQKAVRATEQKAAGGASRPSALVPDPADEAKDAVDAAGDSHQQPAQDSRPPASSSGDDTPSPPALPARRTAPAREDAGEESPDGAAVADAATVDDDDDDGADNWGASDELVIDAPVIDEPVIDEPAAAKGEADAPKSVARQKSIPRKAVHEDAKAPEKAEA